MLISGYPNPITVKPLQFDIIIVYESHLSYSASDKTYFEKSPFAKKSEYSSCNATYQYFLTYCKQQGLRAGFATTNDISGSGLFTSVWTFHKTWKRIVQSAHTNFVFDKFSSNATYNINASALLLSSPRTVRLFHHAKIREIFDNKLKTYQYFSEYAIPTVKINLLSQNSISQAKSKLLHQVEQHKYTNDFESSLILKDQFGFGGDNIFKVTNKKDLTSIHKPNSIISFVLQPFIESSHSNFANHAGRLDLRVIVFNADIIQCYIRIAKPGEFRANASLGGEIIYLKVAKIPKEVKILLKSMIQKLPSKNSLYALDFIKSNTGHIYLMEGNSTPGLNWFNKEDEKRAKQLIRLIVRNIKAMIP